MDAGRELDIIIADRVMGWKVFAGEPGQGRPPERPLSLILEEIPRYSADIAAAWLVVEQMAEIGYWCEMRTPFEKDAANDFWCGFTPHSTTGWNAVPDHWTRAETLAAAVCLAALSACGVEVS